MATGTEAIILAALLDHLSALVLTPVLPIAMPGIDFPAAGQPKPDNYLRASYLTNGGTWDGLGEDPEGVRGILQVSVYWLKGAGVVKPLDVAGAVKNHFAHRNLGPPSLRVKIYREPVIASPIQEDDRVQIPVSIYWHAFPEE